MSEFLNLEQTNSSEPTSSGQHVLIKDQTKIKRAFRRTTIVVNSRDRNIIKYPDSNAFRFKLRRPLTNVLSIELMNGCIPGYFFNINTGWNTFTFVEGSNPYIITLTPGLYNDATLLVELQTQLNAIPGKRNTYSCSQNPNTRRMQIMSTNVISYKLLFYTGQIKDQIDLNMVSIVSINTLARILGFGLQDYTSDVTGTLKSILPMDINNFLNRVYLHLESDGRNLSRMEVGAGKQDCFHIFYFVPGEKDYIFLNKETDHSMFESSPAPISRITTLEISLRDEFNRPLDVNRRDYSLVFEITHLE
ncbi:MAG: hypothetical protein EB127_09525 [Alphaproteobacteria bacterium]|nr:hypothetical protein [Alphaproteobacteria bacterium]